MRNTIRRIAQTLKRCRGNERGQYLIQMVILLPMMLLLVGIVIDGGFMYWQYRRAEVTVNAAAQAASHAIDVEYFRETNLVQLEPGLALAVAQEFVALNQRGRMRVEWIWIGEDDLAVYATAYVDTLFLKIAGITRLPMRVLGHAYPAFGINLEGQ